MRKSIHDSSSRIWPWTGRCFGEHDTTLIAGHGAKSYLLLLPVLNNYSVKASELEDRVHRLGVDTNYFIEEQ